MQLKLAVHVDSLGRSTKSTPSPNLILRLGFGLRLFVSTRFQVYFTVLYGLLFTFPSRYLFTIGHETYLAFPGSTGCFPQCCLALRYSRLKTESSFVFAYMTVTSYGSPFQKILLTNEFLTLPPYLSDEPKTGVITQKRRSSYLTTPVILN